MTTDKTETKSKPRELSLAELTEVAGGMTIDPGGDPPGDRPPPVPTTLPPW
jgi:hypothetical protein